MSEANLLTTGRGRISYRLAIEGWPEMFATGPEVTTGGNAEGQALLPCLSYEGLRLRDAIRPMDGKIEADGMSFKLVPYGGTWGATDGADPLTASFSRFPGPIGTLASGLEADTTTISLTGGVELQDFTYYYLGTETILHTEDGVIERAARLSIAQSHHTTIIDRSRAVFIYDYPPTMEGRRVYLNRYVDGYQLDGDGYQIWTGVVSRPPRRGSDGVSWIIDALPITHLLRQKLAAGIGEVRPIGIYHHAKAAFAFRLSINTGTGFKPTTVGDIRKYTGFDTKDTLIDGINALLEEERVAIGADTYFDSITLTQQGSFWVLLFHRNDTAGDISIGFEGGSYLCGYAMRGANARPFTAFGSTSNSPWLWTVPQNGVFPDLDTTYSLLLTWEPEFTTDGKFARSWQGEPASPLGYAGATFTVSGGFTGAVFEDLAQLTSFPPFRIYLDTELVDVEAVAINCPYGSDRAWPIAATGTASLTTSGVTTDVFFIELQPRVEQHGPSLRAQLFGGGANGLPPELDGPTFSFFGVLGRDTVIKVARTPTTGSVTDFVENLIVASEDANDGDCPFVTSRDLNLGQWVLSETTVSGTLLNRIYDFAKPIPLEDVLAEELKLAAHMPRITEDGRIGIVPMRLVTDTAPVDAAHTIDATKFIAPAGNYGSWPGVEPQGDGIVTNLTVQQDYDPGLDDWVDKPFMLQDDDAIATHKGRGKVDVEIKPYSRPVAPSSQDAWENILTWSAFLGYLSRDYIVITIEVPFTCWPVLCGDTVRLTNRVIPDGTGMSGVIARNCIVVGREWNLDPALPEMGKLTLWMSSQVVLGYAPSALVTGYTNTTGNTWALTCSVSEGFNEQLSTDGDGQCLLHFQDGQYVRLVEFNDTAPTIVTGTISGTPNAAAGTCTFIGDTAWTPAEGSYWLLEYQVDTGSTATSDQRKYQYNAGDDQIKPDGRFAGMFT